MKTLWSKVSLWFWLLLAGAAALFTWVAFNFLSKGPGKTSDKLLPEAPKVLRDKVRKAEEKAMVVRAEVKVKTDAKKKELKEITEISDEDKRIEELAKFLDSL
jgi:hypothetical protein